MATTHASQQRPPLWRDAGVLKWVVQIIVLVLVIGVFWFLSTVAADSLAAGGIEVDYDWIDGPANIQLSEGISTVPDTMWEALRSAASNTLRVAIAGIFAATILGTVIGLARLSTNWVAQKAASVYIETLRNIPVLVLILLAAAILGSLPDLEGPEEGATDTRFWFDISKRGLALPRVFYADGFYQFLALMAVFSVGILFARKQLQAKQDREGGDHKVGLKVAGITLVAAAIAWFANPVMGFLGPLFGGLSDAWGSIPRPVMQVVLSALAIGAAALFVKNFLDSRRTPAGLAKLTDDDYFRMIFAGVGALIACVMIWMVVPGLIGDLFVDGLRDLIQWFADKFGDGRGNRPIDAMRPTLSTGRFANYGPEGLTMTPFFAALFFGLVLYTASFIAEIVRGGVLAVPKGQTEAAAALGLSRMQALRKVILPQAFRVIMPPLGNQYLNITKNTSLAIAVGMSDLVQIGQTIYNKNNQTLAVFGLFMAFYLTCSLTISFIVNNINNRLAIVER